MLFCTERAFRISIDCYDATWARHLELEISIVWYYVESSKHSSSEKCMIADVEWDNIKD